MTEVLIFGITDLDTGKGHVIGHYTPEGVPNELPSIASLSELLKEGWKPFSERQAKKGTVLWCSRNWKQPEAHQGNLVDEPGGTMPVPNPMQNLIGEW